MRDLIIVAASGLARELIMVLRSCGRLHPRGILDDDPALTGKVIHGVPVLGRPAVIRDHPDTAVIIAAGRGRDRRTLAGRLHAAGVADDRYVSVIDCTVGVPESCEIGVGSIVLAGTVLTADVQVGRHVVIMPRVTLTHDVVVDDFATLCAGVSLGGQVRIGPAAYVGMNAGVREGRTVGANAVLGMGAAAIRDIPAGEVWAGVPARPLSDRTRP
ncbi:NeuD/PglB/VioB family sugar acetyltransferase [Microlunatus sp. GCM10028923]|uniref:NeuD/PglB/VioB family sugar acetyltransferase n=1 Tax=Microlunatus sp. GCM10028923 TaxID=3273400 RepID=UPI0036141B67